jgi:Na+-driven multidrug efflux pump
VSDRKRAAGGEVDQIEAVGGEARATARPVEADRSGQIRTGKLAGLSMSSALWVLAWPIMAEALLNSLVGLVDTTLSAGVSRAATDAVGGASYITWLLALIETAIAVGATALIARAIGRGRRAVANAAVGQTMLLAFTTGIGVGALVYATTPALASLLKLEPEAAREFVRYLRICAVGTPFLSVLGSGIACCRGAGDAVRPLWIMVAINLVNMAASWTLSGVDLAIAARGPTGETVRRVLVTNPFPFDLGVVGIGLGTLMAWIVGSALIVALLARGRSGVRLRAARLKPHWHTMRRVARVGLPNFFETFGMWFANFLVLLLVGWMRTPGVLGAHIVAIRVEAFSFLPGFAIGMAAATLVGQYIGAGRPDLAKRVMVVCVLVASALMGLMGLLFIFFGRQITGLFSQQPEHLELAPKLLVICGFVQVPFAIMLVVRNGIRGAGDTKAAFWLTTVAMYFFRLPLAYLLSGVDVPLPGGGVLENPGPWDGGIVGLWWGLCLELVVRGVLFGWRWLHGGWLRVKV